jgi:saccharopine dehydrogenase (NAD+, L-lysine-forming)
VLQNVGMTGIEPVEFEGHKIVPLQFLKALLPEPSSLGEDYTGRTSIGCEFDGEQDGKRKRMRIYNVCDHAECYREVKAQAVSYTTGVPAVIGARLIVEGKWKGEGVFNVEEFDPAPFMEHLNTFGLPWKEELL